MSLRSMNRRLDRLEERLHVRHASIWDVFRGVADFDDLDEDTKEALRQALEAVKANPTDRLEQAINAPLLSPDAIDAKLCAGLPLPCGFKELPSDEPPAAEPRVNRLENRPSRNGNGHG